MLESLGCETNDNNQGSVLDLGRVTKKSANDPQFSQHRIAQPVLHQF